MVDVGKYTSPIDPRVKLMAFIPLQSVLQVGP